MQEDGELGLRSVCNRATASLPHHSPAPAWVLHTEHSPSWTATAWAHLYGVESVHLLWHGTPPPAPSSQSSVSLVMFYILSFHFSLPLPLVVLSPFLKYCNHIYWTPAPDTVLYLLLLCFTLPRPVMISLFSKMFGKYRQLCTNVIWFHDYCNWNWRALFYFII